MNGAVARRQLRPLREPTRGFAGAKALPNADTITIRKSRWLSSAFLPPPTPFCGPHSVGSDLTDGCHMRHPSCPYLCTRPHSGAKSRGASQHHSSAGTYSGFAAKVCRNSIAHSTTQHNRHKDAAAAAKMTVPISRGSMQVTADITLLLRSGCVEQGDYGKQGPARPSMAHKSRYHVSMAERGDAKPSAVKITGNETCSLTP